MIWLSRDTRLLAVATLLLVAAGGMVYEHGHRLIASTGGLLTISLVIWQGRTDRRRWVRGLGWAALGAVIVRGVPGGATVLYLLPGATVLATALVTTLRTFRVGFELPVRTS